MSAFRSIFFENVGIKIAAVVLALLVYFHVKTERQDELNFRVPVELKGLPDSLTWTGEMPQDVTVSMRGKLKNLLKLKLSSVRMSVDVSGAGPGRFQRTLSAGDVPIDDVSEVAVTHFAGPEQVDIYIERKLSKSVRIVPVISGKASEGVVLLGTPTVSPESTIVTGPASLVSAMDSLCTEPIDISERREAFSLKVNLDLKTKPFTASQPSADVFVELEAESMDVEPVPAEAE
jgi:YbbR domain-containing protein